MDDVLDGYFLALICLSVCPVGRSSSLDSSLVMLCDAKCLSTLFVFLKCRLRLLLSFSLLVNLLSHFENWNKVMVYFFLPKGEEHVPLTALYALLR